MAAARKRWSLKNYDKEREIKKRWDDENKHVKAAWREKNKELVAEYNRKYQRKSKDKINAYLAIYRQKNSARVNAIYAKRRAAKIQAMPKWANQFFIEEIYDLARLRTKYLGVPHEVDHIVPLQSDLVCGLHCEANLQVVPVSLNRRKNNKWWPDMPEPPRKLWTNPLYSV